MSGSVEQDTRSRYETVCAELNMDEHTAGSAWTSYGEINNDYVLEGDHLEWLGCSLYVAGQMSTMETIEGEMSTGNNVSLTHILRSTRLSLIEFFKKIKKWQEMTKLPPDFQKKIDTLERKFEVASIIFSKYHRVFHDLFLPVEEKPVTANRRGGRRKHGNKPCSTAELFKFGWTLYIHIKGQYPQINDDLVNSHHLLLCCMDMLFCAAVEGKRRYLLNPECAFLPGDFSSPNFVCSDEKMCILTELATTYGAIEKECRVIRDFYWRGPVKKMFEKKDLTGLQAGNPKHSVSIDAAFVNMISPANFHSNQRALDREYEMSMLANGDFDERMFLHPNASEEIGTPSRLNPTLSSRLMMTQTPPQHVQYGTPFLGREYLTTASNSLTPVSDATHSVTQLHLLLENRPPTPAEYLHKICSSCTADPLPDIETRVAGFGEAFLRCSPQEAEATPDSFTKLRLHLATSLYYKLLLDIVQDEMEVKKRSITTVQMMLEHELFHKALFGLSAEIVLFSYHSQSRVFPWVLGVFEVSAYHFYKLIEVAIKVENDFPRSIIKHLNRVEEMVLDTLAWSSESPLYDAIDAAGSAPNYEDVALPVTTVGGVATPIVHPVHSRVASTLAASLRGEASPIASFLLREHLVHVSPGSARRQLFSTSGSKKTPSMPVKLLPSVGGSGSSNTPTRPVPIAPKPPAAVGSGGGGGVTVTLLRDFLQQQQSSINQQLGVSPAKSAGSGGSPGRFDPSSPLKLAVSMASAGTQTSPCRPLSSATSLSVSGFTSPARNLTLDNIAQAVGLSLSSGGAAVLKTAPTGVAPAPRGPHSTTSTSPTSIPLSPPIPTVSITPSPAKTPKQPGSSHSHITTPSTVTGGTAPASISSPLRPKKTGSLALFYRKVYLMAHLRVKDLCERLDQSDEFHQKVWTCFEYAMLQSPDLMRDRHLDQVVMCCIYVMAKVLRLEITFQEIMRQYRHQPQAKSHIYRSVLLNNGPRKRPQPDSSSSSSLTPDEGSGEMGDTTHPLVSSGTPLDQLLYRSDIEVGARGDIIMFYNKVFISLVKNYALRFTPGDNEPPTLSPLPTIRKTSPSPRRISRQHPIFVSPHTPNSLQLSPHAKKFVIQKSPAAQLYEINEAMRGGERTPGSKVKRRLSMLEASPYTSGPTKRVHLEAARSSAPRTLMDQLKKVATERAHAVQLPSTSTSEE